VTLNLGMFANSASSLGLQSIGIELCIFLVTVVTAFIFSQFRKKHLEWTKLKVSPLEEKAPVASSRKLSQGELWRSGSELKRSDGKWVAAAMEGISTGARDPAHTTRTVNHVLNLYENLLTKLAEQDLRLSEAAALHQTVECYASLVYCVIRASRYNLVERLLDDMVSQGVARPLHFYESTMKQLAGVKKYKLALSVYDRLAADGLQPSAVTLSCLINFSVEVGELQRAISFFKALSSVNTPSIRAYMTVLRVHSMRQDWPSTIWTIRDMQRRGVAVDTLALNVALGTGVTEHLEEVEALVEEADSVDTVSYNTLIKGHAQRGDVGKARQALRRLVQRNLRPNAITFNTVMDAAVRAGDAPMSWQILEQMQQRGLKPDRFTCSILVKGLAKSAEPDLRKALALIQQVAPSCDKAFLTHVLHSVLEACGTSAMAQQVFVEMRRHQISASPSAQKQLLQALAEANPE